VSPRDRPPRILHVEDEDLNRLLFRAVLGRASDPRLKSAVLDEATSLARARELLSENAMDLVLMDVRLPDGSGLDLVREIKASDPELRVVVMSASVLPAERQEATLAGCDAFIPKPYAAAELLDTMARLLAQVPDSDLAS
jgi:two-component system KDP operon response regulator KdpE